MPSSTIPSQSSSSVLHASSADGLTISSVSLQSRTSPSGQPVPTLNPSSSKSLQSVATHAAPMHAAAPQSWVSSQLVQPSANTQR